MRRCVKLTVTVALAIATTVGLQADAVSAHDFDNYSRWYCAWARRYVEDSVVHSVPDYLTSGSVRYYCQARSGPTSYQYWVWTGTPVGQHGYIMGSTYQYCDVVNCIEP